MDGFEMDSGFQISVSSEVMAILAVARDLKDLRERIGRMVVAYSRSGNEVTTADLGGRRRDDGLDGRRHQSEPRPDHRGPAGLRARGTVRQYRHRAKLDHRRPARHEAGRLPRHRERLRRGHRLREVLEPQVPHVGPQAQRRGDRGHDSRPEDARRRPGGQARRAARRGVHQRESRARGERAARTCWPTSTSSARAACGRSSASTASRPTPTPRSTSCGGSPRPSGARAVTSDHWLKGGEGAIELAEAVIETCEEKNDFQFLYDLKMPLRKRIELIAREIYGADGVTYTRRGPGESQAARSGIARHGLGTCMVKTQLSLSHDPNLKGRPQRLDAADPRYPGLQGRRLRRADRRGDQADARHRLRPGLPPHRRRRQYRQGPRAVLIARRPALADKAERGGEGLDDSR